MELLVYFFLLLIAIYLALTKNKRDYSAKFFFFFSLSCLLLSLTVRLSSFDADIVNYASSMLWEKINFYILREPVVWLSLRHIYKITGSPVATFVTSDMILLTFLFLFAKHLKLPRYALFGLLIFFPIILGFQNVYRQFAATIFLFGALAYIRENSVKGLLLFLMAALCHNMALIFLPLLIYIRHGRGYKLLSFLVAILIVAAMKFTAHTKSAVSTGLPMELAYLSVLLTLIFFIIGIYQLRVNQRNRFDIQQLLIFLIIQSGAVIILASAPAERIGMLSLVLIYPMIVKLIETKFKNKVSLRLSILFLGFIPILVFQSTRDFLL